MEFLCKAFNGRERNLKQVKYHQCIQTVIEQGVYVESQDLCIYTQVFLKKYWSSVHWVKIMHKTVKPANIFLGIFMEKVSFNYPQGI